MQKDIAIIGMAGRFPGARNLPQLFRLLAQGKDRVGPISVNRVQNTTLDPGREYMVCGYLEDIDTFDHRLFNISAGEAQTMDPHLRLLLETAYETFEDAAYDIDDVRKSNTAVFVADAALDYYTLADVFVPTLASGNTKAFLASTLSRQFDLRGNSLTVDTTCSSSLMAVHLACNELILGDADMALACGVNLYLFPYKETTGLGLDAPDGKSKAFSALANGMSHGEAVGCVLLKRLDKALTDGDIIHAVIKGSAVNSNAARSASITAPDSEAQAEVIRMAWKKAGIDPRRIGFIEVHGSGTVLGDNIEVGGFTLAFNTYTNDKSFCPISTIKSNIGHTRAAAGIAGLLKAILSLKHRVLFPNIHFEAPHPQINFDKSAVFVNREFCPWKSEGKPRYAGISSIGLSGTNCHLVLEEAPERSASLTVWPDEPGTSYLLPVSSRTFEGLSANVTAIRNHLSILRNDDLADVSYTLWQGRKHYEYRTAIVAENIDRAIEQMDLLLQTAEEKYAERKTLNKLVLVFDEGDGFSDNGIRRYFIEHFDTFKNDYTECMTANAALLNAAPSLTHYVFQYCFYKLLEVLGISTSEIMAVNGGRLIAQVIKGDTDLSNALENIAGAGLESTTHLSARVDNWLRNETRNGPVLLLGMSDSQGALSKELQSQTAGKKMSSFMALTRASGENPLLEIVQALYEQNAVADWKKFAAHIKGARITLPAYTFRKEHCWIRESPRISVDIHLNGNATGMPAGIRQQEVPGLAGDIQRQWNDVLQIQYCRPEDNFFELGGDSIKATQVITRLNAAYNLNLDFEDLFDYPTITELSAYIDQKSNTEQKIYRIWKDVLKQHDLGYDDDFFDLGGHSLIANQIMNRIRREFNVEINFDDFFRMPTIRTLSAYIDSLSTKTLAGSSDIVRVQEKDYYEVSHAQKRLWILSQSPEGAVAYNQPGLYKVSSELDIPMLGKAFEALVERHEILRTSFVMEGDDLVQRVLPPEQIGFNLEFLDFREHPDPEAAALATTNEQAGKYFNLETGPLLQAMVIRTGELTYFILLNLHHIITDGWSNGVMIHDLLSYYHAFRQEKAGSLAPLRIQYKDYAAWQNDQIRKGAFEIHKKYWLQQFQEKITPLRFPADLPRPAIKNYQGRIHEFSIDKQLTDLAREYAKQHNATLFMLLLSNLYVLLYRLSGQRDIVIGTTLANRDHVDLEDQMGFYVNALAIRTRLDPALTFNRLLERVKDNTLKAYEHGVYPFDLLVDDLQLERDMSRSPLFDVMLTLQNMDNSRRYDNGAMEDLKVESIETDIRISKFDLLICVSENNGGLDIFLEYDTALLTESTIKKIRDGFVSIFRLALDNPVLTNLVDAIQPASQQEKMLFEDFVKAIQDI